MRHLQGIKTVRAGLRSLARIFSAILFFFVLLLPCFPITAFAQSLPQASSVPGGIALLRLGPSVGTPPRAWFGEQPVWIASENGQWLAVVGLGLDTLPGTHELRIEEGKEQKIEQKIVRFNVSTKQYPEQRITLKDGGKVNLSAENEARAEREIARIQSLKRHWRDTPDTRADFKRPAEGKLVSRFGLRRFFNGEPRAPHNGLDVAVPRGTPVKAAAQGIVLDVNDYFFNGKTVFVDHGNGLITMVCHLDRIDVRAGESVSQGQPLGLSGMTGRASGPHLHWSVVLNGVMVDPDLFLQHSP